MTQGAALDVERVEVLKGPQGTLFGENSTGGAVNFIAAKPTSSFEAGVDATAARFGKGDVSGFASGPLADALTARLAIRTVQGGAWQYDYTRDGATTGAANLVEARLLLDWTPADRIDVSLNVNGYVDRSENQAPQLVRTVPQNPANILPALASYPFPPDNDRAASWGPVEQYRRNDHFWQAALRVQYDLESGFALTAITSYEKYDGNAVTDYDATTFQVVDLHTPGRISTATQEVRISYTSSPVNWVAGANYEWDRTYDEEILDLSQGSNNMFASLPADQGADHDRQDIESFSVSGNAEVAVTSSLTAELGARFTQTNRSFTGCAGDSGNGQFAAVGDLLITLFTGKPAANSILPGGCVTLNDNFVPGLFTGKLNQNNVSWRAGLNWKPDGDFLVYANISRGYKAGSFPTEGALFDSAYHPVTQESLIAYELGTKLALRDDKLHVSSSFFYYDYDDKQLRGVIIDPIFGIGDALISVPKSYVEGAEIAVDWAPVNGLQLTAGATYTKARVVRYTGLNEAGVHADFAGAQLPFAPPLEAVAGGQYTWTADDGVSAFVGAGLTHHARANAGIGDSPDLVLRAYTTLDLRAGLETDDSGWRLTVWGRNVTDAYYWTNATHANDEFIKYTGMPSTFGITVSYRTQ